MANNQINYIPKEVTNLKNLKILYVNDKNIIYIYIYIHYNYFLLMNNSIFIKLKLLLVIWNIIKLKKFQNG